MKNYKVYLRYKNRPDYKYETADSAEEAVTKALRYFPGASIILCVRLG